MFETRSETITGIAAAWVAAAAELVDVNKGKTASIQTKTGGSYGYKYADLADVIQSARPVLAKHGLAIVQNASSPTADVVLISTTLVHKSGEFWALSPLALPSGHTAQETGSAITYGRRYHLLAALGLAADDDDDGATAAPRTNSSTTYKPSSTRTENGARMATDSQKKAIYAISRGHGQLPPVNIDSLTFSEASALIDKLKATEGNAAQDQDDLNAEEPF